MADLLSLGAAAGAAAATKAAESFGSRLAASASSIKQSIIDRSVVTLKIGFEDYLQSSYIRCRFFKTILNPYEPADLAKAYIPLRLNKPQSVESISDQDLFKRFRSGERIVVTGLAGSGKSMLMRYSTIDSFENYSFGVPLFVELRKINDYDHKDLIDFILNECTPKGMGVTRAQIEMSFREGLFVLILDGFDELEYEFRDQIFDQITDLERDYSALRIIVSSRPDDDRFRAWSSFHVYSVGDFTEEQTIALVETTKYNSGVKERFLKALSTKLFKSHSGFLKSPLLTTIMLLTFEEYAEIPSKMHSFYSRAFDTLFQKHDADKDQFVRKIRTGLAKEDFKLVFSAFCAMSYLEQRFSFTTEQANKTANDALTYGTQVSQEVGGVTAKNFICDLTDAVCMLQPDGLDLTFVHRSFQEYFAAVFIEKTHGNRVKQMLDRFAVRFNDSVIAMALDMAREKVEADWVLPNVQHYCNLYKRKNGKRDIGVALSNLLPNISISRDEQFVHFSFHDINDKALGPLESICKVYPDILGPTFLIKSVRRLTVEEAKNKIISPENESKGSYSIWKNAIEKSNNDGSVGRSIKISKKDNWWLDLLGFNETFDELSANLNLIAEQIKNNEKERQDIMSNFV